MKSIFVVCALLIGAHLTNAACPREDGYCVKQDGRDQNHGVIKMNNIDGNTDEAQKKCLDLCKKQVGATGCEVIWSQGNRGCYIHMAEITRGNDRSRHYCWVFSKCTEKVVPYKTEEIYGAPVAYTPNPNIHVSVITTFAYSINRNFGEAKTCSGSIVGFRVKTQSYSNTDIRINGIVFLCDDGTEIKQEAENKNKGSWQPEVKCDPSTVVTGINYRTVRHRGGTQLKMECSGGKVIGPVGYDSGDWAVDTFAGCPASARFCGFQGEEGYNEIGRVKVLCCSPMNLMQADGEWQPYGKEVCLGGSNDNFGFFRVPKSGFLTEMRIDYQHGLLTCNEEDPNHLSRFGCNGDKTKGAFSIFVTNQYKKALLPDNQQALPEHPYFYNIIGHDAQSADNFTLKAVNPTYINANDELRIWYGEDLHNRHEQDNGNSVVCVNVFGKIF